MKTHSVKVEKIINGGYGLARVSGGRIVMLHNCLPGELVQFNLIETRRKLLFGRVTKVLQTSPHRVEPPCPYYLKCGGCNLQHISYPEQLVIKKAIVQELIQHIPDQDIDTEAIMASPSIMGYRQRIRLQVDSTQVGFFMYRSRKVVPITSCLLAQPVINHVLGQMLQAAPFTRMLKQTGEIELLYNPESENVTALFHYLRKVRPADRTDARQLASEISELEQVSFVGSNFPLDGPYGNAPPSTTIGCHFNLQAFPEPLLMRWEIGGFFQVNIDQNINMINYVIELCKNMKAPRVLDLFCGMGNFSIPLAYYASTLTGVEGQGGGIRAANQNSHAAKLDNTSFIKENSFEYCLSLAGRKEQFDLVIVDPPRQGIINMIPSLSTIVGHRLIYISCDPATLARDIQALEKKGFTTKTVRPFDMFPQTHHIESVAILEKH